MGRESYDLYIGEDHQLCAADSAWCYAIYRVGRDVRDGLECLAEGHFDENKVLIRPLRELN